MISVNIKDSNLGSAVTSLISMCGTDMADITVCDEDSASQLSRGDICAGGVMVLYKRGAYLYSDAHVKLSKMYGEGYCAMALPLDYSEFCRGIGEISVYRRSGSAGTFPDESESGGLTVSHESCSVTLGDSTVKLTEREMALFVCLRDRHGMTVSRETLKELVWKNSTEEGTNVVDVYISYLRRKLSPLLGEGFLISIRGSGYRINLPPSAR